MKQHSVKDERINKHRKKSENTPEKIVKRRKMGKKGKGHYTENTNPKQH
jgi:hypothetical protein